MKKRTTFKILMLALVLAISAVTAVLFTGCVEQDGIHVIIRQDGSGTRVEFDNALNLAEGQEMYEGAQEITSNGTVITTVAGNPNAIGYISYNTLNDTVRAVNINGFAPSHASFPISRPFIAGVNDAQYDNLQPLTRLFWSFLNSTQGQTVIATGITPAGVTGDFTMPATRPEGDIINLRGSSSVAPLMTGTVIPAFIALAATTWGVTVASLTEGSNALFNVNMASSSAGFRAAVGVLNTDIATNAIAFSSAELTAEMIGVSGQNAVTIALDVVAVVVHPSNDITNLTLAQVRDIFTGSVRYWGDVA